MFEFVHLSVSVYSCIFFANFLPKFTFLEVHGIVIQNFLCFSMILQKSFRLIVHSIIKLRFGDLKDLVRYDRPDPKIARCKEHK